MNQALELLQTQPAEQLRYNLEYIAKNARRDFVAEALRPEGKSLTGTVEFLYAKQENYNLREVSEIADFVNGFDGIGKITREEITDLGSFEEVNESRKRHERAWNSIMGSVMYGVTLSIVCSASAYLVTYNLTQNEGASFAVACAGLIISIVGTSFLEELNFKIIMGDTKPKDAFNSLHYRASLADNYIQLYKLLEEKGLEVRK